MQPLTKQELQAAMQQLTNNIASQAATKQDLTRAIDVINQQSTAQMQNDMQRIFRQYADTIVDTANKEFGAQNAVMQKIAVRIEAIIKKFADHEQKIAYLENLLIEQQQMFSKSPNQEQRYSEKEDSTTMPNTNTQYTTKTTVLGGLFG
jgi:hypothetical protein